jgi:transcriptional regulator with XRE-family HTH domain
MGATRTNGSTKRRHLSECLRRWRARIQPEETGIPVSQHRRSPGLRREDVATLVGTSLTWYARFESGMDIRVSSGFIERLAAVLRLNEEESAELFGLAIPEFKRGVDHLLRQASGNSRLQALAHNVYSAVSADEAAKGAIDALFDSAAGHRAAHVASLDASGALTFTQAQGPLAAQLLELGTIPFGDFPANIHVVEDASVLDGEASAFYQSLGIRSSLCMCVTRSRLRSIWIGYLNGEPHHFTEPELTNLAAISGLLRSQYHEDHTGTTGAADDGSARAISFSKK